MQIDDNEAGRATFWATHQLCKAIMQNMLTRPHTNSIWHWRIASEEEFGEDIDLQIQSMKTW